MLGYLFRYGRKASEASPSMASDGHMKKSVFCAKLEGNVVSHAKKAFFKIKKAYISSSFIRTQ